MLNSVPDRSECYQTHYGFPAGAPLKHDFSNSNNRNHSFKKVVSLDLEVVAFPTHTLPSP